MYKKGRVNSNSRIISTDEDPSLRIESSAIINLRGVSTKLNKYILTLFVSCDLCSIDCLLFCFCSSIFSLFCGRKM